MSEGGHASGGWVGVRGRDKVEASGPALVSFLWVRKGPGPGRMACVGWGHGQAVDRRPGNFI